MTQDRSIFSAFSDAEFRAEAQAWANLQHENLTADAAYRVDRLMAMLDASELSLKRASTRTRQLEAMTKELFGAYIAGEAKVAQLEVDRDEWKRCAEDLRAEYGTAFATVVQDEDILGEYLEAELEASETKLLRLLGSARADILDILAVIKRIAPTDLLARLWTDIRLIFEPAL